MADIEKVTKGLCEAIGIIHGYVGKRYWGYGEQACRDAIELLKEKKARVMTLDEVITFDWDYCYLEEERLPGKEYRKIFGDYALTCITWPCIASMRIQHGDKNYGRKWRCWSAKPTEEQRKAEPWKEGEQE